MPRAITDKCTGIKVLREPASNVKLEDVVDIVAVHGIGAHPDDTWTKKISPDEEGTSYLNWLSAEHMLPAVVPNARIMRYGYKSIWFGEDAIRGKASDVADKLLRALRRVRNSQVINFRCQFEVERANLINIPRKQKAVLSFSSHIVMTVIKARISKSLYPGIFDSIAGILFFGTPFRGTHKELSQGAILQRALAEYEEDKVQRGNLAILDPGNEILSDLVDQYFEIQLEGNLPRMVCFYELQSSNIGGIIGDEAITKFVVDESSGCLDGATKIALSRNHFNMNKFGPGEEDFLNVCDEIENLVKNARYILAGRSECTSCVQSSNPSTLQINVPPKRVFHYVLREALLTDIKNRLLNDPLSRTVILCGMGGSGKTQLALEICQEVEKSLAVMWIDASSPTSIGQSYKIIAGKISQDQRNDATIEATISFVTDTLKDWKQRWLVVFDNYDDPSAFQTRKIRHYIPSGNKGRILFTSRRDDLTRLGDCIKVSEMTNDESLSLLLPGLTLNDEERIQGLKIADTLGHLALALDQAGAYIRARRLQLKDFLVHYSRRKEVILKEIPEEWEYSRKLSNDEKETMLSVFTTWELSFDMIRKEKERKDHFLTLAAFFDNKTISEKYFRAYYKGHMPEWMEIFVTERKWNSYKLGDVLAEFQKLSLLQQPDQQGKERQFSIHPVVRDWIKLRKSHDLQQQFALESIVALSEYLEDVGDAVLSLEVNQETILHIDACVQNERELLERQLLGFEHCPGSGLLFAFFYTGQGRYGEAEELYNRALKGQEEKLGRGHPDTLRTVQNLAIVYEDQGRYGEAKELFERALKGQEEKLGRGHPDTLRTVQSLAIVYHQQGRYDEAEELYNQALKGWEEKLGRGHPDTLRTVQNLALVYRNQGRYDEAEKLFKRALEGQEEKLGREHPDTLRTVHNLAGVYQGQGRYSEAEELYKRALKGQEEKLGCEHPDTLTMMQNLANVYQDQGRYSEAEELYNRALEGQEEKLGREHPDTLRTVQNLASVYRDQRRYDKAEGLFERALKGQEEKLGRGHPDTLRTVQNLANVYRHQGRYSEAEELHKRALKGQEEKLGRGHPETLRTVQSLALVYRNQGRYDEAEKLFKRALKGREEKLGREHPHTLTTVHSLAVVYQHQGRYGEAEELYNRALKGWEEKLGCEHPDTLMTVQSLAIFFDKQGRHDEAKSLQEAYTKM
ncbi:MAG: hypothetical protein M1824_003973 [Vezdaea acicularis]|nr:MAG: hypothetical protein M1824_003973 [Vezdaea acicularis]